MRKKNNIIEINGQRYDATTGVLLSRPASGGVQPKPIDGVKPQPVKPAARPAAHKAARHPAKPLTSRKPKPSHTLMRQAVKKPAAGATKKLKAQGHTDTLAKQQAGKVVVKPSAKRLDEKRLREAARIARSNLIRHFSPVTATKLTPPATVKKPARAATVSHHKALAATPPAHHVSKASARSKATSDLLDRALKQANSHTQPQLKRPKRARAKRGISIGAVVVLAVALLGVIVTQNMPDARLQMASAKAGFDASLPAYQPSGFRLDNLNYSDGVVAAKFHSNSDDRRYTITQKPSSWDSAALRDNFVAAADSNYQTVSAGGRTVYIYGKLNSTWVSNGIWYQIQTNGALSDRQIVKLASSL